MTSLWVPHLTAQNPWSSDCRVSVFAVIPPRQERFLIPWLVNTITAYHNYGRFRYFFIVSDRLLWRFTSDLATTGNFKHYTVGHILASTLFDIKFLTKMSKSDFVPPITMSHVEKSAKSKRKTEFDASKMALITMEPRVDLATSLNLKDCALYAAFVRQLTARRHARLIPTCEYVLMYVFLSLYVSYCFISGGFLLELD